MNRIKTSVLFFSFVIFLLTINSLAIMSKSDKYFGDNEISSLESLSVDFTDFELKDCNLESSVLYTESDDSWVVYYIDKDIVLKNINIDISEMSCDEVSAVVFYDYENNITGDYYIEAELKAGENNIELYNDKLINIIRIDFSDRKGDVINLNHIILKYERK